MNNTISIVVIDSGIDTSVSDLKKYVINETGYGFNSDGYISEIPQKKTIGMHGTTIALIIRDVCKNVKITSINILNERLATNSQVMLYAMAESIKLAPDIIHMSIGTRSKKYKTHLKEIVKSAIQKNIVIVAACNNFGFKAYPANIEGVVGVKTCRKARSKDTIIHKGNYYYAPSKVLDIEGKEYALNGQYMRGTSIAAAYVTGNIAKSLINK